LWQIRTSEKKKEILEYTVVPLDFPQSFLPSPLTLERKQKTERQKWLMLFLFKSQKHTHKKHTKFFVFLDRPVSSSFLLYPIHFGGLWKWKNFAGSHQKKQQTK
jgi:hypothetical protein